MERIGIMAKRTKIPAGAVKAANNHLAEGEQTGHFHDATGDGVSVLEHEGRMYLDAPSGSTVTHQEHGPVTLPPGQYERRIVMEYDHLESEAREVRD